MMDWWDMWPQDFAQLADSPFGIFIGVILFVAAAGVVARIGWIYIHKD